MHDEYLLPYGVSMAFTDVPIHDCYVNLETDPKRPPRYVYAHVYPAFPYRLTTGSIEGGDLALDPGDRRNNDPLAVWKLLHQVRAVPPNLPGKIPGGDQ